MKIYIDILAVWFSNFATKPTLTTFAALVEVLSLYFRICLPLLQYPVKAIMAMRLLAGKFAMEYVFIRMPFLRYGGDPSISAPLRRFNPGLSEKRLNMAGNPCFTPRMPFGPAQAERLLAEMRTALANGGGDLLHGYDSGAHAREMSLREEMAALADFMRHSAGLEEQQARENILRHAQTLLLWRFAAEELEEEIMALARQLHSQEEALRRILTPETPVTGSEWGESWNELPWLPVLRNALNFFPDNAAIFMEGAMAKEVAEALCFHPGHDIPFLSQNVSAAYAAAEEIPGLLPANRRKLPLSEAFSVKRWWIIQNE